MPSLPKFLQRSDKSTPAKSSIARYGSLKTVDDGTLAKVYESSEYNTPDVAFGPGTPPRAMPMDASGQPRRYQGSVGHNLISQPGQGRLDPSLVQSLVDNYDLMRAAIYIRIDEIAGLDWDITPDPLTVRSVRDKRDIQAASQGNIQAARAFFKKPDRVNPFQIWMRNILEDHFVTDSISIYKRRTYGGRLYALEYIDGSGIKPLVNLQYRKPDPPEIAFQQYLFGKPVYDFTADELIYMPQHVRPRSVYGFSVVEQFMLHINLALRFQAWNTAFFTDGNIPSRLLTAPDNWTADKIEEWQQLFDALIAGDPAAQRKLFMIPPGVQEVGGGNEGMFTYALEFSNYLIDITCVATGVTRQELGLEPGNSDGLGGSGLHDAMESVHNRRLVRLANFLADTIFTPLLQEEFGLENFVWSWPALEAQDPQAHAELNQLLLFSGQKSLDEILMEQGQEPVGIGRFLNLGGKLLFEKDLLNLQSEGTLKLEEQQAADAENRQKENQKELVEHQAQVQQQTAEHAQGLEQDTAEHAAGLQATAAEQQAGFQQQAQNQQAQTADQQRATKGDMDMDMADHQHQLSQEAMVAQQQFQAQQSQQSHQFAMEQGQQAAQFAQQKALALYHAKAGLPPPMPVDPVSSPAMAGPSASTPLEQAANYMHQTAQDAQQERALMQEMMPGHASDPTNEQAMEVAQWGRKLEKAAKSGKSLASVRFVPNFLTPKQTEIIQEGINKMTSPDPQVIRVTFRNLFQAFHDTPGNSVNLDPASGNLDMSRMLTKEHKYGTTHFSLPGHATEKIHRLSSEIKPEDLSPEASHPAPHLTVQYGIGEVGPDQMADLRRVCAGHPPVNVRLGHTAHFSADTTPSGQDVVIIPVEEEHNLRDLRKALREVVDVTDTTPTYRPHITITSVKPGRGEYYANNPALNGTTLTFDTLILSDKKGQVHHLPLNVSVPDRFGPLQPS